MAAALRQHAALPPSPILRSLFPAPYSKAAAAAAATASLPSVCRAPLPLPPPPLREVTPRKALPTPKGEPRCCTIVPSTMSDSTKSFPAPYSKSAAAASLPSVCRVTLPPPPLREVIPRKAPPTPKGEPRCCKTVPSTMIDSTKSFLDKLKDLKDSNKSLQDMRRNIEEHTEMVKKGLEDRRAANDLFQRRLDGLRKLNAKIRYKRDYSGKINAMYRRLEDDYDKDWAIQAAKARFSDEQVEMLLKEREDYADALRRYHELERSIMEQVEKVKKVAKVGAAVGLVGGLLLILAKI